MEFNERRSRRPATILGPIDTTCWVLTILTLAVGIGVVATLLVSGKSADPQEKATTVAWVAVAIGITASVVVFLLSIVFATALLRGLGRALPLFGATAVDRLLGLGITILLFRSTVGLVFGYTMGFLIALWRVVPEAFSRGINPSLGDPRQWERPEFRVKVARELLDELYMRFATIPRSLPSKFPFAEILIALAIWSLCGQLLQSVPDDAQGRGRYRLTQLASRLSRVAWLNTLLFAIIGTALYFSTAAIVAVPTLKEFNDPSAPTIQALQSRLKEKDTPAAKAEFDAEFPETYGADDTSLAALKTYLDQRETTQKTTSAAALSPRQKATIEEVRNFITAAEKARDDLLTRWKALRKSAWDQNRKLISDVLANFETASTVGNGKKERVEYSQELQRWHDDSWSEIRSHLQGAKEYINLRIRDLGYGATATRATLDQVLAAKAENEAENGAPTPFLRFGSDLNFLSQAGSLLSTETSFQPPLPPNPGLELGPFSLFAGWLVETRSLALAMIIGMLGFGLLGSAVSTFVREQKERRPGDPLVNDLAGVLIRGLSAAIIVFLAAVGGLAILGSGQSDPNPYVLFLGCLVGAVYSQEVWDWARVRMVPERRRPDEDADERPPDRPPPTNPPGPAGGSPPPEAPAEPQEADDVIPVPEEPPPQQGREAAEPEPERDDRARLLSLHESKPEGRSSRAEAEKRRRHAFALVDEGHTRSEVASRVGISVSTLYRWLANRSDDPRSRRLRKGRGPGIGFADLSQHSP